MDKDKAEELMQRLISLREVAHSSNKKEDIEKYRRQEKKCIESFKYIVLMKTNRYKNFFNYEDLIQEGLEALVQAMKTYNPKKGIFFYWAHKYIDTRISRKASLHTAIRFPLQVAKKQQPYRESFVPSMADSSLNPEEILQSKEINNSIDKIFSTLSPRNKKIMNMYFGIDSGKPQSVFKISQKLKLHKAICERVINKAIINIKKDLKIKDI